MKQGRTLAGLALGALSGLLGFGAHAAAPAEMGCKGNASLTGQCYRVRGTVSLSGDSGLVLGRDDTGRALVIWSAPHSTRDFPANLSRALDKAHKQTGFVSAGVHGTFEVCPIPGDLPDRNYVCIESAAQLTAERVGDRR
jgi:hypothetical protein